MSIIIKGTNDTFNWLGKINKQKAIQIIANDLTNIEIEEFDIIKGEVEDSSKIVDEV